MGESGRGPPQFFSNLTSISSASSALTHQGQAGPLRDRTRPSALEVLSPVGTASGDKLWESCSSVLLVVKFRYLILGESKVLIYFAVAITVDKIRKFGV